MARFIALLALLAGASAEPRRALLQNAAEKSKDMNNAMNTLGQLQAQVVQLQAQTTITPQCANQIQDAENSVENANNQASNVAQNTAGNQATIAAWDPSQGGTKPAPWPFHSWPLTQGPAGYAGNMQAMNEQIQANQQLVAAYGTC
jgi:hypothetical protein